MGSKVMKVPVESLKNASEQHDWVNKTNENDCSKFK